jgi:16S rRNA (cytosine967-C5)-methyltransferase
MTPAARLAAAAAILDAVLAGARADRALADWGRGHRFAGSGDRAAIADHVHDALRRRRSLAWAAGSDSGRGLILALAAEAGQLDLLTGEGHAPPPPTEAERAALARDAAMPEAVALDMPDWLMPELARSLGSSRGPVLAALRRRAPLDLRVNLLKGTRAGAAAALAAEGIGTVPLAAEPAALRVTEGARRLRAAAPYRDGRVEIQDLASQRVARFAGALPGETVLDFCAGGGGKTLALAMHMGGTGRLIAHDADAARMADLMPRAARAGVRVERLEPGAPAIAADLVLVDAPCSGSGAWRRNPDAKWRLTRAELDRLTALQDRVLSEAARHVRPGGRLVYATCSLLACENADRVDAFLRGRGAGRPGASLRLLPPEDGDGFYACMILDL